MRKVIDRINNGQIKRNSGTLIFSTGAVEHTISSGSTAEGSFSVSASTKGMAEGRCLSNDYRMEILTPEFSGMQDQIAYRFHGEELTPGTEVHGMFVIISNRGEYEIPFEIHVEAEVYGSSLGPVRNLFHFVNLAKTDWNEALKLFYDPGFTRLFTGSDREFLPAYRCLSGVPGSEHNMDEFLVAMRRKTPVEYIPSEKSIEISDPSDISRYELNISRNGWGYTHFYVEAEGDFLSIAEREVGFDMFLGNTYTEYYYVDASKVHPGKNYGSIVIRDGHFEVRIPVLVNVNVERRHLKNMTMTRMKNIIRVMEQYQLYRLKKISSRTWMNESTVIVEEMLANDPEDLLARLYQIHLMITQDRNNEAVWNLKRVKNQALSIKEEQSWLWCYYLYLQSLVEEDSVSTNNLTEEVEYCFRLEPRDWRIAWLLSYMSDEYVTVTRKWVMFETVFENGCNSPVIYLEAARMVMDNPAILSKLSGFDLQVIRYICKRGLLNGDIVFAIRTLAEHCREYSEPVMKLLEFCYGDNPHDELLMVICTLMIKGNRTDADAFRWYGYAVKQELKITRLYEYYMMSLDKSQMQTIPRIVLMYFSFHSDLDYETNAYLYASVVLNRTKDPDMYSRYQMQISDYVSDQLAAGRNNRYLAVLYRNLIDDAMLKDDVTAARAADVIFMYEVDMSGFPGMKKLILCYDHCDRETSVPITSERAVIPIYSDDYALAMEDAEGSRMMLGSGVEPVQLMPPGRLLLTLQIMLKNHMGMDIHCCMEHRHGADVRAENEFRFRNLLEHRHFAPDYAKNITMKLVRFYYEQDRMDELDGFLDKLMPEDVADFERPECIRFLVKRGRYDKAMEWVYRFGPEGIDRVVISDLLYGWLPVNRDDTGKNDPLVRQLLIETLQSGRTNKVCVQYLMNGTQAGIKTLRDIWQKAGELGTDRRDFEEYMIIQLLYSGAYLQERGKLVENYAYEVPDGDILRAALAGICYEYFVDDVIVSEKIFPVLTDAMDTELELDNVCFLAYVKYYAENRERIDDRVKPALKAALHILLAQDTVLACFRELADFMPSMARFADSTIIEYRTEPGTCVNIHYIIESDRADDYHTEPMNEIYGGVYSRSFTIFFGEKLLYYITEGSGESADTVSESNSVMHSDISESSPQGRFGLINDICVGDALKDYSTVDELLDEYYRRDFMTSRLFGMHKG